MAQIITMPKLGFDMAEGTLVRWVILEGEVVNKGAVLAEIETDKATVEVESQHEGVLFKHLVSTGEIVPVNKPIAVITQKGEDVDLPSLLGDQILIKETVTIRDQEKPAPEQISQTDAEPEMEVTSENQLPGGLRASPLARRMAQELMVNLELVKGTGPEGRITKKDVELYFKKPVLPEIQPQATFRPTLVSSPLPTAVSSLDQVRQANRIPIPKLRAIIGRRMTESKQNVPHFYVTHEYDVEELVNIRKKVNAQLKEDEKTSLNDYIIKAVALVLRQYPNLNASLDSDQIIQHGEINIGVAVAVEGGLLTVVIRNTDLKSIRQISSEIREMVTRAREGKVRPGDIEGSTFTVSNMGMFDVENFAAIINPPEIAILAVSSAKETPIVIEGEIKAGYRMKATISADHRVTDGVEAARFLQTLGLYLGKPVSLLL